MERYEDRPFAIVGINTDSDKEEYLRLAEKFGVTWRSAWQGSTDGPIPSKWGVRSYPTIFVLDADHVLRHINARGETLGTVVADLMQELEREVRPAEAAATDG